MILSFHRSSNCTRSSSHIHYNSKSSVLFALVCKTKITFSVLFYRKVSEMEEDNHEKQLDDGGSSSFFKTCFNALNAFSGELLLVDAFYIFTRQI